MYGIDPVKPTGHLGRVKCPWDKFDDKLHEITQICPTGDIIFVPSQAKSIGAFPTSNLQP